MAPIDPYQLLKTLGPLLKNDGGIDGDDNAKTFSSLMQDGKRLVSRCIYVNILKATDTTDLFDTLLESGVWNTLNTWLQEAKEAENKSFLFELLSLYRSLPVTVDILKKNNAAKTIKHLCRSGDEEMKTLASSIVNNWMMKIRSKSTSDKKSNPDAAGDSNGKVKESRKGEEKNETSVENELTATQENAENSDDSKVKSPSEKRRRKHHHSSHHHHQKDHHKPSRLKPDVSGIGSKIVDITMDDSKPLSDHSRERRMSGSSDSERTPIKLIISKGQVQNSVDATELDDKKRAKTVKVRPQKFRSTGLNEDIAPLPKKKSVIETKQVPPKRGSQSQKSDRISEPPEKKTRPYVNTSLTISIPTPTSTTTSPPISTPTEIHGKIKIIPAKPFKVEIKESSGFMDALTATPTLPSFKKKKKPMSRLSTSPTTSTLHPPPLVIATTTAMMTNTVTSVTATMTQQSSPSPSPSTHTSFAKVPSFYRETLDTNDNDLPASRSPSPPKLTQQLPVQEYHPQPDSEPKEDKSAESQPTMVNDDDKSGVNDIFTKKRRTVTWASEANLREIFYFEMDDTERENVNRTRDFNEMKKFEAQTEKKAMESAKRMSNDRMNEEVVWYRPEIVDDVVRLCEPGKDSLQRDIQMKRETGVLQALYFAKNMLPDSPSEADLEILERGEPTAIPLEDENSINETMHSYDNTDVSNASPVFTPQAVLVQPMHQPGMQQPGMQQPGMQQPGMQQPGMPQLGMPQLGMQQQGPTPLMATPGHIPPMGTPVQGVMMTAGISPLIPTPNMTPPTQLGATPQQHPSLPADVTNLLASLTQGKFDPTVPAMSNSMQLMSSLLNSDQPPADENLRRIQQLLEPYKQQLHSYMSQMAGYNQMYMGQNQSFNNMFNPMMQAGMQPGFNPMMGPRPRMPMFPNNGGEDWSDNMRGGPPPFMRKRGFPPRGGFRGGRGRGGMRGRFNHDPEWKPLCRNLNKPEGCKFGNQCQYFHPNTSNRTMSSNGPS